MLVPRTMRLSIWIACWAVLATSTAAAANHQRHLSCDQLLASSWVRELVITNLNQLKQFPGQWALASQQIMLSLIGYFNNPNFDLAYFERLFRMEDIPLYLVATSGDPGPGLAVGYPPPLAAIKEGIPAKYWLWVGVRGQDEADRFKASLGISDDETYAVYRRLVS